MPNVFVFANGVQQRTGHLYFDVISEDGVFLSQEVFESREDAHSRLGVTSKERHDHYARYYPNGFTVVAVDDPEHHSGFQAAMALHRAMPVDEYAKKAAALK
jgi:hypothetical protein